MKRLAICISGQPRGLELSARIIRENLIFPNLNDYEVDVYYHGWFDPSTAGKPYDSAQPAQSGKVGIVHPLTDQLLETYFEPQDHILEPNQIFTFADDLVQAPSAIQRNLANMFYSMYMADVLRRRSGIRYDTVLRIRYDLWFYDTPIRLIQYQDDVDAGFVCTSKKFQDERESPSFYGGYTLTDIFAFGNEEVMTDFSNTYLNFTYLNTVISPPYGENYLGYQTKILCGHPVKTFDLNYEILHRVVDINTLEGV